MRSEANEILHALIFGGDAILAGSDADRPNSLLDDVQDFYAFFSGRTEDPPATTAASTAYPCAAGEARPSGGQTIRPSANGMRRLRNNR